MPDDQREQFELLEIARQLLPSVDPLQACHAVRQSAGQPMTWTRDESGYIRIANVQTCKRRYCPVCGPKIQAQRREKARSIAHGADVFWGTYGLTFTWGHEKGDSLPELLTAGRSAMKRLSNGRSALTERFKAHGVHCAGWWKELEYIYSLKHGHAPHFHASLWAEPERLRDVTAIVKEAWQQAGHSAGLTLFEGAAYVQKITLLDAAGYPFKDGQRDDHPNQKSRTAFQLLREAADGEVQSARLWLEYVQAVRGLRLSYPTPRLKHYINPMLDDKKAV